MQTSGSPNYRQVLRGYLRLHQLTVQGRDESPDADTVRDSLDLPWRALSVDERKRVQGLSADLFSVSNPVTNGSRKMSPQAQKHLVEAIEAKQRGEWERALDLLREWGEYIAPAVLASLRGGIWLESGYPEVAAVFYENAKSLEPDDPKDAVSFLHALEQFDLARASDEASQILGEPDKHSASLIIWAANITFNATLEMAKPDMAAVFRPLIQTLERALQRFHGDENRSVYLVGIALLAFCHEHLGEMGAAIDCYSRGLRINPSHDALLIGRGILTYGKSPQSPSDLEQAIELGSPLVWPYFFLAHHYAANNLYEESRRMCERGLAIKATRAVHSQLSEWLAIAKAELGFSPGSVRAAFEQAIRLDPSNEMARKNLERFEQALPLHATATMGWEKRSESTVRIFGQAERRASLAMESLHFAA